MAAANGRKALATLGCLGAAILLGCPRPASDESKDVPPLSSLTPAPLPVPPARSAGSPHAPELSPVWGDPVPSDVERLQLRSGAPLPARAAGKRVLLAVDDDVALFEAAPLLARLDDAQVAVWLAHPDGQVAFRLVLRDEAAFGTWLTEPKPGKVRIIQRADGLELVTNVGKLPGRDPNGPSLPTRSGFQDIAGLRRGLAALKGRFDQTDELCVVPSFATRLARVADVLSGTFTGPGEGPFEERCVVYPRPRTGRGDGGQ